MKKLFVLALSCFVFAAFIAACATQAVNPEQGPTLNVQLPEEPFSNDPDDPNVRLEVPISVTHRDMYGTNVKIKEWKIEVRIPPRVLTPEEEAQRAERRAAREAADAAAAEAGEAPRGERQQRGRAAFYEESGTGTPPTIWKWNGRDTNDSRWMTSATDYQFRLTVTDVFDNTSTFEGIIQAGIMLRRDGKYLKVDVDSIVFQADLSNFLNVAGNVTEENVRVNRRVMNLLGRALGRYEDYSIVVEGHANAIAAPGTNPTQDERLRALSESRAQAIVDYLVTEFEIDRDRLSAIGRGTTMLLEDHTDPEVNYRNRRVEFILEK